MQRHASNGLKVAWKTCGEFLLPGSFANGGSLRHRSVRCILRRNNKEEAPELNFLNPNRTLL